MSVRKRPAPAAKKPGVRAGTVAARRRGADVIAARGSTRARILDAAERLFAENGYDGVSMPMLAGASGITAGAIYKHFDSKDDLFFEVVRRAVKSAPTPRSEGPADALALPRIVAAYATPEFKRFRQLAVEIHYASGRHPDVRRLLRRSLDDDIERIRSGVVALQQAKAMDPAIDARRLACLVLTLVMGLAHMETLAPQLVGDAGWRDFLEDRTVALLGARRAGPQDTP